jgi:phosphoribosylglycinamide formyltransferase-1
LSNDTKGEQGEQRLRRHTRLGILMSDSCEHCMAIAQAVRSSALPGCEVAVVVSNVTGAAGIETARAAGLPVVVMEGRGREQRDHESAISTLLRTYRVDLVCVAGYLRVLSPGFIREWRGRILAIHPSLLPAFPGAHAVEQALAYGVRYTGCTVFLASDPDPGTILIQRVVEVESGDTSHSLNRKIIAEEALAYPEAIRLMLGSEFQLQHRRIQPHLAPDQPGDSRPQHQPQPTAPEFSEPAVSA